MSPDSKPHQVYRAELYACTEEWLHPTITYLLGLEEQFEASEKYAAEGWAWLDEALKALGAETVFDIAQRKEQFEAARQDNARLALEAATADQDWKRAEAEANKLRHALTQVRAECDLPDYIAEFVGEALMPSSPNVRKSWGPERMRHDPEQRASGGGRWRG